MTHIIYVSGNPQSDGGEGWLTLRRTMERQGLIGKIAIKVVSGKIETRTIREADTENVGGLELNEEGQARVICWDFIHGEI